MSLAGMGTGFVSGAAAGSTGLGPYGSLIGGAIGGLSGLFSGGSGNSAKAQQDNLNYGIMTQVVNQQEAAKARDFNASEAEKQRTWATDLANSAHTREIADLQNAGLNPILSVTGGSGATTPSGASASGPAASVQHPYQNYASDYNNARKLDEIDKNKYLLDITQQFLNAQKTASDIHLQTSQATKEDRLAEMVPEQTKAFAAQKERDTVEALLGPHKQDKMSKEMDYLDQQMKAAKSLVSLQGAMQIKESTQAALNSASKIFTEANTDLATQKHRTLAPREELRYLNEGVDSFSRFTHGILPIGQFGPTP